MARVTGEDCIDHADNRFVLMNEASDVLRDAVERVDELVAATGALGEGTSK